MILSLSGRIQTRLIIIITVGSIVTALATPFIPSSSLSQMGMSNVIMTRFATTILNPNQQGILFVNYQMAFETLGLMAGVGVLWELIYFQAEKLRHDRDWPAVFVLFQVLPEGVVLWYVAHMAGVFPAGTLGLSSPVLEMFVIHLALVWLAIWMFLLGPMRVLAPYWHWHGGQFRWIDQLLGRLFTRSPRSQGTRFATAGSVATTQSAAPTG